MGSKKIRAILLCIVAVIVLIFANAFSTLGGYIVSLIGIPFLEPIVDALLYPLLAYLGAYFLFSKRLKYSLDFFELENQKSKEFGHVSPFHCLHSLFFYSCLREDRFIL